MATSLQTASTFRRTMGLAGALNHQWSSSYADALHCYDGWLSMSGTEALYFLQGSTESQRDGRFHFMLRCSKAGDEVAARVLLQAMLPKAIRFAANCRGLQTMRKEDALCSAVGAMCESISIFNLEKTKSVTGNLTMRALKLITTHYPVQDDVVFDSNEALMLEETWAGGRTTSVLSTQERISSNNGPAEFDSAFDELMSVLFWASEGGVLTAREVSLLGTYSTMSIPEAKEWAQSQGRSYKSLCNQVSEIRVKLARAVKDTGLTRGSW